MKVGEYEVDVDAVVARIKEQGAKRVVLQLPEGLKASAVLISNVLQEKAGVEVLVFADPCYGACDVFDHLVEGVDMVVQMGHTAMPDCRSARVPTMCVNAQAMVDIAPAVENAVAVLKEHVSGRRVGVATTAQHVHQLKQIKQVLEEHGFTGVVGETDDRVAYDGQVLGCDFSAGTRIKEEVDGFLFVGSGQFHPLGLRLTTDKTVVIANPFTGEAEYERLEELRDAVLRQRFAVITRARPAQVVGVLIGAKLGQQRLQLADELRKLIVAHDKKAVLFLVDEITPDRLAGFRNVDCFVSTACPRIAIDEHAQFKRPVMTPLELEIALGTKKWSDYRFDQILG